MKKIRQSLKKRSGRTFLALVLAAALTVGGMTTAFATEEDMTTGERVTEEALDAMPDEDSVVISSDESDATAANIAAEDVGDAANDALGAGDKQESDVYDASPAVIDAPDNTSGTANTTDNDADTSIDDSNEVAHAANSEYDLSYGLYGGYDGQDSMDDPDTAGACVGWDVRTLSSITSDSGLWWIDDYYIGEKSQYDTQKTDDFSLKYQVEFHASEDLDVGSVQIVIDASLGTYRNGNNIIPTELGIPYGYPSDYGDTYTASSASPFNYYFFYYDGNGEEVILTDAEASTCHEDTVYLKIWNYREIVSGSNAMFQVLYKGLNIMQIYDMTKWSIGVYAEVDIPVEKDDDGNVTATKSESVNGNPLTGDVDTYATLTSVTKKAYSASSVSYTPELYTKTQINRYISGSIPEPYASNFDDYIYTVWQVSASGRATQAWTLSQDYDNTYITYTDDNEVEQKIAGSIVGTSASTSSSSTSSRTISKSFYVVTAYPKAEYDYLIENYGGDSVRLENDVQMTVHPQDGYDADTTKSATATTTWGEYAWKYHGDIIGITKSGGGTYNAWLDLYEINAAKGEDTGAFSFSTKSTDRGFSYTHYVDNSTGQVGEWIEGSYYTTTTVDDALYVYPNSGTSPSRMLTKDDYYFSSVKVTTTDNGYDIWEDTTAGATEYEGVDQSVYIYAMFYNADEDAMDDDGWEYVATVPFSTSGTMTYTFTSGALARQPYRVKAVHNTANYATYCTIALDVMLRYDSPMIKWCYDYCTENGISLDRLRIENLSGVAGQTYNVPGYENGHYFQDTDIGENHAGNYSEHDTYTEETLLEFTEGLYGTVLMRDNAYLTLTRLTETAASSKSVSTENDTANGRVLANYTVTAYEAYQVTGSSTVDAFKDAGISLPNRQDVAFYDLLPYGMQFNPNSTITAGRITTMSGSWSTNARAWDTSGVTVTVEEEDVITDWNGTGRTMVIFHIHYNGDDASAYYNNLWFQGYGISFQAYYDWTEVDAVDAEYNIAAYIAENVEEESRQLLGGKGSQVYKDDGSANLASQYAPFMGVSDLNGDGVTDLYTNMYASTSTHTNVATSSSDNIKKTVRADVDAVAEYGSTAVVANGKNYTYEITLTNNSGATLSDVVMFDHLEYAVEDGRYDVETQHTGTVFDGLTDDQIYDHWTGTFLGVTTTALDDLGISAVVYYNESRNATVSENGDDATGKEKTTPSDVLTEANGWYEASVYAAEHNEDLSEVRSIAVDISTKTNGDAFEMNPESTVSIQIHMQAPEDSDYQYAFNNPMYYSVSTDMTGDVTSSTDAGNTVRVEIGEAGTLEVEKEFRGNVPASVTNQKFTFTISRSGQGLANQEYMVYNWNGEEWVSSGVISATDIDGQFTLRAGQKAVFSRIANAKDIEVTEVENVLWDVDTEENRTQGEDPTLTYAFANAYRSPVYLSKSVQTTDLATEEELENAQFTFQLLVDTDGDGEYEPYANGEYLYVKEALTDGSSPALDTSKGDAGHAYTDENGYVTIGIGDIIAFFPCDAYGNYINVPYKINETETGEDWTNMGNDTVTGTTSDYGTSKTITNYYKYRNLILTKDLSDYDHDLDTCEDEWTFQVTHVTTDGDGNETTELVTGNHWYMIDADGNPVYDDNEEPMEGYLSEEGTFSFTGAGSGRRIVIEKLVEGEEYILAETNYDAELYEQVNDGTVDTTMPTYAITRSITVTNKYLLKDLEVSKLVLSRDTVSAATHEFTFTLEKYENGDYIPVAGAEYTIDGVEYETNGYGEFTLKNNETAVFDDIGYQGDIYRIAETPDDDFEQIYPTNNGSYTATLGSDGDAVRFINGNFDDVVSIKKELNGLDEVGKAYVDIVGEDNTKVTLTGDEGNRAYTVDVICGVYNTDGECVTESDGALIDYDENNTDYPYIYIKISADGSYKLQSYNGGEMTESLAPYDYIYVAEIGNYTVKVSEASEMERIILDVTSDVEKQIGSGQILSEGDVMSGSAAANEDIVLVNDISSAHKESEIYKLMTEDSDDVPAGSQITFIVQIYDAESGTWSPASGIKYITMDGCTGVTRNEEGVLTSHNTEDAEPTTGVLTTGADGKITLAKTEEGYPYIRFIEDEVYANVYEAMEGEEDIEDGTLRIIESESGTDEEWGHLVGYDGEGWVGGPAYNIPYADTFYNGNDDTLVFEVEKEMTDGSECDDEFTFYLKQILSASISPITSMDQILDSAVGAGVTYVIYDVETGEKIGEGVTGANGSFTLKAGQYARFYVPEDTTWYVYEGVNLGYPFYSAEANDDKENPDEKWGYADNASIVDETNGVVQNEHSVYIKEYDVKYAVSIYGIQQDTYQDSQGNMKTAGLTFGPATGKNYISSYEAHLTKAEYDAGEGICLHWMSWDEIIEQSQLDPKAFEDCLKNGCTHSVNLMLNNTLCKTSYMGKMDDGDGTGNLFNSINTNYVMWNSSGANTGGWPASQVRAVLNGKDDLLGGNAAYALDAENCLLSCLPEELQNAIVAKAVKSDTIYNSQTAANNTTTYDKLWLFSCVEIWADSGSNNSYLRTNEGTLYQRSDADHFNITTESNSKLANYDEAGAYRRWWLRSLTGYTNSAYNVGWYGSWDSYATDGTVSGLAPGFCLPGPEPTVNYAVKLWGICADTYSYDEGATTDTASLTFGPATGANHLEDYVECGSGTCIHKLSWDEIIAYCNEYQGNKTKLTELFGSCLERGCTKAVKLTPNEKLFNMTTVDNYLSNSSYTGDGVSTLYYLLNGTGSSYYTYGVIWNYSFNGYSSSDPANIYSKSRIRVTLNGDLSDAELKYASSGGEYGDGSDLCNEYNCLLSCFPANLQNAMVPRKVLKSSSSYDKTTYDKLFLFTLQETGAGSGSGYGVNASNSDRIAYEFSGKNAAGSSSQYWWTRTPVSGWDFWIEFVSTSGSGDGFETIVTRFGGLSPGFCIK